jgi:hypothetical protein
MEVDEATSEANADMIWYLERLVGSYFHRIFAFNFLFWKSVILFGRFDLRFCPAISLRVIAMKKGGTPPFFTFNFSDFSLSISSLA